MSENDSGNSKTGDVSATESIPPLPVGVLGQYALIREIGRGGMGRVYLGRDTQLERTVAVKVLPADLADDNERLQRFFREAKAASALNHPNVATIHGIGESGGVHFIAMEFVDGETLAKKIQAGRLPRAEVVPLAAQLVDALAEAHRHGIIHRDIKPANVMVNSRGQVKVLDFGLARHLASPEESISTSLTGSALLGTAAYMSPEHILLRTVDSRSDIFSVGVVLYEMATGRLPFKGDSTIETLNLISYGTPQRPSASAPDIDPRLEKIILRCLEKNPSNRYESASQLLADLQFLIPSASLPDRGAILPSLKTRVPATRLALLTAAVITVVVITIALWKIVPISSVRPAPRDNIVILPFEPAHGDNALERAYGYGLTEALTASLIRTTTKDGPVQIVPWSEMRSRPVRTPQDAKTELGATHVVAGIFEQQSGVITAKYQIFDLSTGKASSFLGFTAHDAFTAQDQLVDSVARALNLKANVKPPSVGSSDKPGAYEYYLQGRGYLQYQDKPENIDNAISVFQQALAINADYGLGHAGLGLANWAKFISTQDPHWAELARSACERSLALDQRSEAPYVCLGTINNGRGRFEQAIEEFKQALDLGHAPEAYSGLARAYAGLGKLDEAESAYRRAITERPYYWGAYFGLGNFYYSKARYAEAEQMYAQVVALAPDNVRGYTNLGTVAFLQGKINQAMRAYEKSLDVRPTYIATSNLGTLYFYERGDFKRAAQFYRQALSLNDTDYRIWGNLGSVLNRINQAAEAREAWKHALQLAEARLKLNPRDAQTVVLVAEYQASLGNKQEATALLEQALNLSPNNPELFFRVALIYEDPLGNHEAALDYLERAINNGYSWNEIQKSDSLKNLRRDPRFKKIESIAERKP